MKKNLFFMFAILFVATLFDVTVTKTANAAEHELGVGIAFSGIVGLSLYSKLNDTNFAQGAFAWGRSGDFAATADYAFAYPSIFSAAQMLTPFWGFGLVILHDESDYWVSDHDTRDHSETLVGGRIPLGLNFVFPKTPIQVGAAVVPTLLFTPISYGYFEGEITIRILF